MSQEMVSAILTRLKAQGLIKVHFSGGEVLLHREIEAILEKACQMGLQVNLTSNGTLLNRSMIKAFTRMGVHAVSISLDSATASVHDALRGQKGAHKATIKAIQTLIEAGSKHPCLRVNTVLTRQNFAELPAIHAFLKGLSGSIRWKLLPVDSPNKKYRLTADMVDTLASQMPHWDLLQAAPPLQDRAVRRLFQKGAYAGQYYQSHYCYMPWLHLFIDPAGFVYPCCMSKGRIPALARFPVDSLERVHKSQPLRDLKMAILAHHPMDVCQSCDDFIEENQAIEGVLKGGR